jgi:hypothetical protein
LAEETRQLFGKIAAQRVPSPPDATIFVEDGAWQIEKIFLERVASADGDSGWYVGRADGTEGARTLAMPVRDLLQSRQDLAEALTLPAGYLVLLEKGNVSAVLDEKGADVWAPIK